MHTDEYEISLSREIDVYEGLIRKLRKTIAAMEARHGIATDELIERIRLGSVPATGEFLAWRGCHESLLHSISVRDEYIRLLDIMKVSSS